MSNTREIREVEFALSKMVAARKSHQNTFDVTQMSEETFGYIKAAIFSAIHKDKLAKAAARVDQEQKEQKEKATKVKSSGIAATGEFDDFINFLTSLSPPNL